MATQGDSRPRNSSIALGQGILPAGLKEKSASGLIVGQPQRQIVQEQHGVETTKNKPKYKAGSLLADFSIALLKLHNFSSPSSEATGIRGKP